MVKRTLFLGKPLWVGTSHRQLIIKDRDKQLSQPLEDIGWIIVEHPQVSISVPAIQAMADQNVLLIFCDSRHMPASMLLPLDTHYIQNERFRYQIQASKPLKKQLWQQIVKAKLTNQGRLLNSLGLSGDGVLRLATQVRSGDTENMEARAARLYWSLLFRDVIDQWQRFREGPPPNNLLNYGYAILRSAAARALISSGLLPLLGIHHHNRYNAYCLADDLMEPYRSYVDSLVYEWVAEHSQTEELTKEAKAWLLQITQLDTEWKDGTRPLMNALQRSAAQLAKCFTGERKTIQFPKI